ncbi:ribonucleotide reductase of class Ia [Klebsiella pneumoniae]|uniref:Ribonucleoside-diphosphate reductase 1 subunit alpha n=1 Tax=Klebsiella pneumoniae TaxID=573 RepID=A0A377XUS8_KLEPN|nr:ribonucleotide reductase of class Ia [Klebsiella pneumoniae]
MWHLEVESLLVLKNNRGTGRQPRSSHGLRVQINKLMYTRLLKGGDITLFSLSDVPGLYDAFFADQDEFERLYTQYEQDDSIRKQRIKAVELFSLMMQERASTGRIYIPERRPLQHPQPVRSGSRPGASV